MCLFAFLFFFGRQMFFFHEQSEFIRNYRTGALLRLLDACHWNLVLLVRMCISGSTFS